jgi:phosphoribosylformylglycinamidine synthase
MGGRQAVAESWRNLVAVGARPLAITDNMNFGNPERPEIMGQFVGCIEGMAEACRALDYPVVSGNVSLYNETNGKGILPTPVIGGVGLVDDVEKSVSLAFKAQGQVILSIGETTGHLGQSIYLREMHGKEVGAPPAVDLSLERKNGEFVRAQIVADRVAAAHDCSDGGLLVAIAEMAMAAQIGAELRQPASTSNTPAHAYWFGEDQARYVIVAGAAEAAIIRRDGEAAGVTVEELGRCLGTTLSIHGHGSTTLQALKSAHEAFFPRLMGAA